MTWNPEEATSDPDGLPDTAIVPYIEALNSAGIETYQSCSGHTFEREGKTLHKSGLLWFAPIDIDPRELASNYTLERISLMYEPEHCWEVVFPGLAQSEEAFDSAMHAVFDVVGLLYRE